LSERVRYPKQAPGTVRVYWRCELCDKLGAVDRASDADVSTVANLLESSHAATSPTCSYDVKKVRVSGKPIRHKPYGWDR
jgi:hypothetical protein